LRFLSEPIKKELVVWKEGWMSGRKEEKEGREERKEEGGKGGWVEGKKEGREGTFDCVDHPFRWSTLPPWTMEGKRRLGPR
jgi:hypothetical protein